MQGDYGRMCGNYRPVQKLNGRKILTFTPVVAPTAPAPGSVPTQPAPTGAIQPTVPVSGRKYSEINFKVCKVGVYICLLIKAGGFL